MPCSPNAAASTSMDASVDEMPVLVDHAARATIGKRSGSLLLSTAGKGAAGSGWFNYDLVIVGHGAALHAVDMVGSAHCCSAGLLCVIYGGLYCHRRDLAHIDRETVAPPLEACSYILFKSRLKSR